MPKKKAKAKQRGEYRDSSKGQFTTAAKAAANPRGTTHETNTISPRKRAALASIAASLARSLTQLQALAKQL